MKLPEFRDPSERDKPEPEETPDEIPERPVHRPATVRRPTSIRRPKPGGQAGAPLIPSPDRGIATGPGGPRQTSGQGSGRRGSGATGKGINPGLKLRAFEAASRTAPPPKLPMKYRLRPDRELARRAAWDVAAISSLVVNAILAGVLLMMAFQIRNLSRIFSPVRFIFSVRLHVQVRKERFWSFATQPGPALRRMRATAAVSRFQFSVSISSRARPGCVSR